MDLGTIRTGLQAALATISGLRASDVWPDTINTPVALVKPMSGDYHQTRAFGPGLVKVVFEITILAAPLQQGLAKGQKALDPYLGTGAGSVQNAVEADQSLGGTATSVVCHGWKDYGSMIVAEIEYVGAKFDVEVTS